MKYLIYLIAIICLLGINIGFFSNWSVYWQIPNLLFLFSLCFVLDNEGFDFVFVSFISGLFLDFFSADFFGGFTLSLLVISFIIYLFINNVVNIQVRFRSLAISVFVALVLNALILWFYGLVIYKLNLSQSHILFKTYMVNLPSQLFYSLILIYPVYFLASNLREFVDNLIVRRRGIVR